MDFAAARALLLAACAPVPPLRLALADVQNGWAAEDIVAPTPVPPGDLALRDGIAVASADLVGASAFSPALLMERPTRVSVGEPLPPGCDALVSCDSLSLDGPPWEVSEPAAPGEGVRRAGEDLAARETIAPAGCWLDPMVRAALREACVETVAVRRPRVRVVVAAGADSAGALVADLAAAFGAHVLPAGTLDASGCDLLLAVGGTGEGVCDGVVAALRQKGRVFAHGLSLDPGRTGAVGQLGSVPFIAIPGRFDGALGLWLALVAPALRRLAGAPDPQVCEARPLSRKIASAVGMTQIVLLKSVAEGWAPLATGDISLAHGLRADGFLLLDAGSEGLGAGALVRPMPLPSFRRT